MRSRRGQAWPSPRPRRPHTSAQLMCSNAAAELLAGVRPGKHARFGIEAAAGRRRARRHPRAPRTPRPVRGLILAYLPSTFLPHASSGVGSPQRHDDRRARPAHRATALAAGHGVLTSSAREFSRVSDLRSANRHAQRCAVTNGVSTATILGAAVRMRRLRRALDRAAASPALYRSGMARTIRAHFALG